jgi:hypothetical protein
MTSTNIAVRFVAPAFWAVGSVMNVHAVMPPAVASINTEMMTVLVQLADCLSYSLGSSSTVPLGRQFEAVVEYHTNVGSRHNRAIDGAYLGDASQAQRSSRCAVDFGFRTSKVRSRESYF